jgi:hypothetical protein
MTDSTKYKCSIEPKGDGKAVKPVAPEGGIRVLDSAKEQRIIYIVHVHP